MTTNQSELVETILSILGVTGRTSGNRPEQIATLEQEIVSYITADRKRVALEARLDELIWSTGVTYKYDKDRQIVQDRIAELKAQQEEV